MAILDLPRAGSALRRIDAIGDSMILHR